MLDKMKVILVVGMALQFLKAFFPTLDFGEEFEGGIEGLIDSLYVVIPVVIGWFTKESEAQMAKLATR
jgi:hypothetical protein